MLQWGKLLKIKRNQTIFVPDDDLRRVIVDARRQCESQKERENLDRMLEDHRKALYPGCDDGLKKLGCTLDLLNGRHRQV